MAHALIFGASGISGWALLNAARTYPSPTTFKRITGTTNRPLTIENAQLPKDDDRLQIVSGINLTKTVDEVAAALREKVKDIETVSHVFFTAYIDGSGFEDRRRINTSLLEVAVRAAEKVAPKMESFILQTGGKGYGLEFPDKVKIQPPLREDYPRIPEPWASNIFYYTQYDMLKQLSQGKSWTYTEVRPDGIVGFVPGTNAMNLAQGIAIYLTLIKEVKGAGASVPFPGHENGYYHATHSDTSQDILAQFEIFAAINTDKCGNGAVFNVADGKTVTWAQVWPKLCEYFGLVGTAPQPGAQDMLDFVKEHHGVWANVAKRHDLNEKLVDEQGWDFVRFMLVDFDFPREYDLSRARSVGFKEEIDTAKGYFVAWDRMREAKILPPA